jgi:hypothetical protein
MNASLARATSRASGIMAQIPCTGAQKATVCGTLAALSGIMARFHCGEERPMRAVLIAALLMIASPALAAEAPTAPVIEMWGETGVCAARSPGGCSPWSEPTALSIAMGPVAFVRGTFSTTRTCFSLLNGVTSEHNWWQEMAGSNATVVVINLGLQDALAGWDTAYFKDCLTDLLTIAQGYGKIVVIETPNPVTAFGDDRLSNYAAEAIDVALQHGAFVIDQATYIFQYFPDWRSHLGSDGMHPDDSLYIYRATVAVMTLAPLIKMLPHP